MSKFGYLCECSSPDCRRTVFLTRKRYLELAAKGRILHNDHKNAASKTFTEGAVFAQEAA